MPPTGVRLPEGPPPAQPTNNNNTIAVQRKKLQQTWVRYLFIIVFIYVSQAISGP